MSFSNLNIEHMVHLASQHSYKVTCSLVCRGTEAWKDPEHIHKVHQNEIVLILVGSGCCYEWIGYPRVPKITVSDWVLKLQLLCFPHETPFSLFLTQPFLPLNGILEDDWETKSVLSWDLRADFCPQECHLLPSGMPSFSTQKRFGEDWGPQDEFSTIMSCWDVNCFASLSLSMLC